MTVLYSGNVQGVGFRYTAKTVAAGFEIVGRIRNLPDGRVELIAEGLMDELNGYRSSAARFRSCWLYQGRGVKVGRRAKPVLQL